MASTQLVIFKLESEEFGVDIMKVREIIKPVQIVKIPNTPEFIEGIINLRGKVHPIFSLRKKFKFVDKPFDDDTKIVIVNVNDSNVGFIVDEVSEIVRIDNDQIEAAPRLVTGVNRKYISGVGKIEDRMIILLDLDLVLSVSEQEELRAMNG
ncbi:MAG: chemotaxis protein CheW [Clostridia bacterium]|jgi:purine-binding chemotaxis protein CheW|uniref:chemotaxis protein CheW n=1 Tax=Petroclostridium xylanilyticum TaxID=1792311 RepID=UPI000B980A00|nr:chemotaxis protein CheW [Petroclostridium xylanilyticum]MBZ4646194.1 chemotaxis protein CheW [Clostridia bacterium]